MKAITFKPCIVNCDDCKVTANGVIRFFVKIDGKQTAQFDICKRCRQLRLGVSVGVTLEAVKKAIEQYDKEPPQ